jgi:dTDP-4-amino-4,6-dideoxygalactose transaminase
MACDMKAIIDIASRHNIRVVEDAAHSLPTTSEGRLIGSLDSDITVFSFYATKTVATGEGGMLVTRNAELAARSRVMRLHGIDRDAFDRYTSNQPAWQYRVVAPGFKYNMTDLAASLGIHQLKKAWIFQKRRAEMAERYDSALRDLPVTLPPRPKNGDLHAWHLYVIRLDESVSISRDAFIEQMAEYGIGCSVHYIPLHLHPYWRDTYNLKPETFPNTHSVYGGAVSLPLYTKMTDEDQLRVIETIQLILK